MDWNRISEKINAKFAGKITNKVFLDYYFYKYGIMRININELKKQHIILYNDDYYRLYDSSVDKINIFKLLINDDEILFEKRPDCKIIELLKSDYAQLTIAYIKTIKFIGSDNESIYCEHNKQTCQSGNIFHGTDYSFPKEPIAPYNYFGNWYTPGLSSDDVAYGIKVPSESVTYMSKPYSRLYQYKIKNDKTIILFSFDENDNQDDNKNIIYIFAFLMYFDIKFSYVSENVVNISFLNNNAIVNEHDGYEKYNYTQYKNLLDTSLPRPPFVTNKYFIIKSPSNGDGDKPLATKICELSNDNVVDNLKMGGWIISSLNHFLNCSIDYLENVGVWLPYKDENTHMKHAIDQLLPKTEERKTTNVFGEEFVYLERKFYDKYDELIKDTCEHTLKDHHELEKCLMLKLIKILPINQAGGTLNQQILKKYEYETMKHLKYKQKYLKLKNKLNH